MKWFQAAVIFIPIFVVICYFTGAPVPDTVPETIPDTVISDSTPVVAWVNIGPAWEALVSRLKHEEGFRSFTYLDSRGFETIGYGTRFPFTETDRRACFESVNLDSVMHDGLTLTQGDCLLRSRLSTHYIDLINRWEPFTDKPEMVQLALTDMGYQLGVDGLLGFHKMLSALQRKDYPAAILEAENSAWDKETPSRVDRVVSVFRDQIRKG